MARRILFVTTDQQRYDTLGCNGGTLARTPVVDALAENGVRYERAVPQSVVCMPSRSTMITGQHPATHGVWMNGVPLPVDAPSVATLLHREGFRTSLVGKAHFEPFLDPLGRWGENRLSRLGTDTIQSRQFDGQMGPHRGFEHMQFSTHGAAGWLHYADWIRRNHPEAADYFYPVLDGELEVNASGFGDTGAPQVKHNEIPKEWYHTDWIAERTISWLDGLGDDEDWFCWMSFPDPHHPWDPPASELGRINWRDVDLPAGYPESSSERERILDDKPRHWRLWYDGRLVSNYEAPAKWVPASLTADQVREVNALNAIECELIDEALGRVLRAIGRRGWDDDLDIVFTTDHGEFQGDFGLLFKGPYHTDSLMRLPLIWRPAPSRAVPAAVVTAPVGLIDLAPTFCQIGDIDSAAWMQGKRLPTSDTDAVERGIDQQLTGWDSELFGVAVHLRTITRDGWVCTAYLPGTVHDGSEGELYSLADDPLQQTNRFDDPSLRGLRDDLLSALLDAQPPVREPRLHVEAPV
ncbi:MAG: sulfatase-like hydrolase/transferase [Microthrixaceae bacterium]